MSLYTVICLTMLYGLIDTTAIQTDLYDRYRRILGILLVPLFYRYSIPNIKLDGGIVRRFNWNKISKYILQQIRSRVIRQLMTFSPKDCHIPDQVDGWTIHGLWPSESTYCNKTWRLTHEDIGDLHANLSHYWPSLTKINAFKFWEKEWHKHGTCAACADSMSSPHKYFSLALQLRMKFTINEAFVAAGITPSCDNSYTLEHFHSALTDLGTHVVLQCYKITNRQILMQIKIPLSKDLSVGCNTPEEIFNKQYYHPCTNKAEIYFYPFTSHPHNPCP